jgi:Oxidoreductase molybdopterin binding domain
VPLRGVLEAARILLSARFVNLFAYDNFAEGIDTWDAFHPRTILAYGMNGRVLPLAHGSERSMATGRSASGIRPQTASHMAALSQGDVVKVRHNRCLGRDKARDDLSSGDPASARSSRTYDWHNQLNDGPVAVESLRRISLPFRMDGRPAAGPVLP